MIRYLLCEPCGAKLKNQAPEGGYRKRMTTLLSKKPEDHFMIVNGERIDLPDLLCDFCNETITNKPVVAVTMWRTDREEEPEDWESEFRA